MEENKQDKPNTFAEMESAQNSVETTSDQKAPEPIKSVGEVDIANLSDVAVGDQKKYNRPDLGGTEDVIDKFQIFLPSKEDEQLLSRDKKSTYWKVTSILFYSTKNEDGMDNKEYISGGRCFVQRDGSVSPPSFWYKDCRTQVGKLWELVAEKIGKEPEKMSPREFAAFLNSKPKVKISSVEFDNYNAPKNSPKTINKNMPGAFL